MKWIIKVLKEIMFEIIITVGAIALVVAYIFYQGSKVDQENAQHQNPFQAIVQKMKE